MVNSAHLHKNIAKLLMHFAPKVQDTGWGQKPICFPVLFSSLPSVSLISRHSSTLAVIIHPLKEWHYLGFYFDSFLSFSSHVSHYANKALKIAQNLWIMGHCHGGIDPRLRHQTYYAVCWSVMTYGVPLWYWLMLRCLVTILPTVCHGASFLFFSSFPLDYITNLQMA